MKQATKKRRFPILGVLAGVLILVLASSGVVYHAWNWMLHQQYPQEYQEIVEEEAARYELDPMLVYAVIRAESGFDEQAESAVGARGLMQLMPSTFDWLQEKDREDLLSHDSLFDPQVNIHYGCALLRLLIDLYGSEETAICAYNAGMGTVSGWLEDESISEDGTNLLSIPYPETAAYLERVLSNRSMYQRLYGETAQTVST